MHYVHFMHLFPVLISCWVIIRFSVYLMQAQVDRVCPFDPLELVEAGGLVNMPVPLMRTQAVAFQDSCHTVSTGPGERRWILGLGNMKDVSRPGAVGQSNSIIRVGQCSKEVGEYLKQALVDDGNEVCTGLCDDLLSMREESFFQALCASVRVEPR